MIELPKKVVEATRINPRKIILYSKPKVGKTEICSKLENSLIIDFEEGTEFVDAVKIDVKGEAKKNKLSDLDYLKELIKKLKIANEEKGTHFYKYGIIDTVTALEEMVLPLANKLYKKTPQGKNWEGDDVTTLPQGAGYQYTRRALWMVLQDLEECFETLIILGHLKDKLVEKEGKEMTERGLDLIGKSSSILCSQVDSIGYMYREDNKAYINFKPSESILCGNRIKHLENQVILISESDEKKNVKVHWDKIFLK